MQQRDVGRTRVVVGITGGSGSGKTTFAERLLARLKPNAVLLSHDDYYKHLPHMTEQEAAAYDFDCPGALDTSLLVAHLRMLKDGKPVAVPSYNFAQHARTEAAYNVAPAPVVLVEGMLIMCDFELLELFDLTVFIDADPDVRAVRRIVRDCRERGATLERAVNMYLDTCKPAHEHYVEPCKAKADIVVKDALQNAALDALVARIESLLGE